MRAVLLITLLLTQGCLHNQRSGLPIEGLEKIESVYRETPCADDEHAKLFRRWRVVGRPLGVAMVSARTRSDGTVETAAVVSSTGFALEDALVLCMAMKEVRPSSDGKPAMHNIPFRLTLEDP